MNKKLFIVLLVVAAVLLISGCVKRERQKPSESIPSSIPSSTPTESEFTLGPWDYDFSLMYDGLNRKYLVHVPMGYDKTKPAPLVMAFHGGGGDIKDTPAYFGLDTNSDKEGFILVYPAGYGKTAFGKTFGTWNAGECCSDTDDVGFVEKMIEKLESDFDVDENRIYVTGFSNGGRMAYRVACELSDKIAAAAPIGSAGTIECNPKRPIPFFFFDGTADPCTPFEGGDNCGRCFNEFLNRVGIPIKVESYHCDSADQFAKRLVTLNGCSDISEVTYQKGGTRCITYSDCKGNSEVVYCVAQGGGHNWPGQKEYTIDECKRNPDGNICNLWKEAVGPLIPDFDANEQIWEFFKKHPMN